MAKLAAAHHERLDGAGYPFGLTAADLSREMRILTVADIFDALTADRPYRAAMPVEKAYGIMDGMQGSAIDAECYAALKLAIAAEERAPVR
jgi:HD-GYP domain-containing protein (c-di-GMP phosphodiesterase class II)